MVVPRRDYFKASTRTRNAIFNIRDQYEYDSLLVFLSLRGVLSLAPQDRKSLNILTSQSRGARRTHHGEITNICRQPECGSTSARNRAREIWYIERCRGHAKTRQDTGVASKRHCCRTRISSTNVFAAKLQFRQYLWFCHDLNEHMAGRPCVSRSLDKTAH